MTLDLIPHGDNSGSIVSATDIVIGSDNDASGAGDIVFKTAGVERARITSDGLTSGTLGVVVLVWSDADSDYLPAVMKGSAGPKEFRGPTDPSTVAGVVLHVRDIWDSMS